MGLRWVFYVAEDVHEFSFIAKSSMKLYKISYLVLLFAIVVNPESQSLLACKLPFFCTGHYVMTIFRKAWRPNSLRITLYGFKLQIKM